MADPGLLGYAAAAIGVFMTLVWLLSLLLRDASIVDVFWGPGFIVTGALTAWLMDRRRRCRTRRAAPGVGGGLGPAPGGAHRVAQPRQARGSPLSEVPCQRRERLLVAQLFHRLPAPGCGDVGGRAAAAGGAGDARAVPGDRLGRGRHS